MTIVKKQVHEKTFDVAWGDMDALRHVNNARYFDYFQQARIDWLASLNLKMDQPQGPVVIHISCTFLKPVIFPAKLLLKSSIHSLGRSSFFVDHDLYQDDVLMAEGKSKLVWVDYEKNQSIPVPLAIKVLF